MITVTDLTNYLFVAFRDTNADETFLLNTLNNIYALIAFDSDKAQQAVQELSKLLRYVLSGSADSADCADFSVRLPHGFFLLPYGQLRSVSNGHSYALIAFDSDKAQQAVQELSKLLRYVLYDNQQTYVPLCKEVLSEIRMLMKLVSVGEMPCLKAFSIKEMKISGAIRYRN